MPFGLKPAPATLQLALDLILTSYKCKTSLAYMDDIILFSKDVGKRIHHVDEILNTLGGAVVTLNLKNCRFFSDYFDY